MVADPARSRMLSHLLSGEFATAGELAHGRLGDRRPPPAATSAKLLDARFVVCEPRGRHRYYRLADAEVAHALEALALVAERGERDAGLDPPGAAAPARGTLLLRPPGRAARRAAVRRCLREAGACRPSRAAIALTDAGRAWLAGLGLAAAAARAGAAASPTPAWTGRSGATTSPGSSPTSCSRTASRAAGCAAAADRAVELTPAGRAAAAAATRRCRSASARARAAPRRLACR